jgi:hypothetical protein
MGIPGQATAPSQPSKAFVQMSCRRTAVCRVAQACSLNGLQPGKYHLSALPWGWQYTEMYTCKCTGSGARYGQLNHNDSLGLGAQPIALNSQPYNNEHVSGLQG